MSIALFGIALAGCSKDPATEARDHLSRGDKYLASGQLPEAVIEFRNATQLVPRDGEAHAKLADAYLRSGNGAGALKEYVNAADLLQSRGDLQLKAGTLLLYAGQFEDARARADAVLALDGNSADGFLLKANALIGLKDLKTAVDQVQDAIQSNPDRGEIYTNLGAIEMADGRRNQAEAAFKRAVQLSPESLQANLALGNYYWLAGQWKEAEAQLVKALALAPRDEIANRVVANYFLATGRAADAEGPLKTVYELTKAPEDAFALADYYVSVRKPDTARAILQPLTGVEIAATEARIRLATIEYRSGQRDQAIKSLDAVLAANPSNEKALVVKAQFQLAQKQYEAALATATSAAAYAPKSTAAHLLVARASADLRRTSEAIAAYQEVLRLNPRMTEARLVLAKLQLAQGETDQSVAMAREAVASAPASGDARLALAQGLVRKGDLGSAERELTELARRYPASAPVHAALGTLHGQRNQLAVARADFEKALSLQADNMEALTGLAALDLGAGKVADARRRMDAVVAAKPNAEQMVLAARVSAASGDRTNAERLLTRALDIDPDYLPTFVALGSLYISQNKLPAALAEYRKIAEKASKPLAAMTMSAVLMEAMGDKEGATAEYKRVLALDANSAVAANNLAWMYAEAKSNLPEAEDLARRATGAMPENASTNDTLGYILILRGNPDSALPFVERSATLAPNNAVYQYHVGLAHYEMGDPDRAKQRVERALQLNPSFAGAEEAKTLLARLR